MGEWDKIKFVQGNRRLGMSTAIIQTTKLCPKCGKEMRDVGRYLSDWRCTNPKCGHAEE
jgi:tRNA(Ile2) C34 agmatinyltransferase TiaS